MTPIVVDASVAVKWFVQEDHREDAACLIKAELPLVAPDFVLTEFANIIWKKSIKGEVAAEQAKTLIEVVSLPFSRLIPAAQVVSEALEIGLDLNHSIYDCVYLACAAQLSGFLVTADRRLYVKTRNTRFAPLVRFVSDAPKVAEFSRLAISLKTLLEIIELAKWSQATRESVHSEVAGREPGRLLRIVPVDRLDIPSPTHVRLEDALNDLSALQRADLIALALFGDALPGEYHDWAQCRSLGNGYDVDRYFVGYMQPQLLTRGLERFLGPTP
jgi:predicted nucleic acid-binding protein